MKQLKMASGSAFNQFDLSKKLLQNLNKYNLTPTSKLVLMYLADCYNPKKAYMFPKQKTIAAKLGISEASVIRAISELHKANLIMSERKYTRLYIFTSYFLSSLGILNNNMQVETSQNDSKQTCKMTVPCIEQKREQKNITNVDDFKILKDYAINKKAKNINAYINTLKSNGSAENIIKVYKQELKRKEYYEKHMGDALKHIEAINSSQGDAPSASFKNFRRKLIWQAGTMGNC